MVQPVKVLVRKPSNLSPDPEYRQKWERRKAEVGEEDITCKTDLNH